MKCTNTSMNHLKTANLFTENNSHDRASNCIMVHSIVRRIGEALPWALAPTIRVPNAMIVRIACCVGAIRVAGSITRSLAILHTQ